MGWVLSRNHIIFCSANNSALKSKRKTLSAGDVFTALQDMEFEEFLPELKDCLDGNSMVVWLALSPASPSSQRERERERESMVHTVCACANNMAIQLGKAYMQQVSYQECTALAPL